MGLPTLYILQRDSYVVKSAKIRPFCLSKKYKTFIVLPW